MVKTAKIDQISWLSNKASECQVRVMITVQWGNFWRALNLAKRLPNGSCVPYACMHYLLLTNFKFGKLKKKLLN